MVNRGAAIKADKSQFGPREKVTVTLNVSNEKGQAIPATLSVGVWDARQVVPVRRTVEMENSLDLQGVPETLGLDRFSYPIEKSLNLTGTVTDEKGKGTAAQVTAFVNDFQGMIDLESGSNGNFVLEEMEFYGPMKLAFSASDKKGKPLNIDLFTPLKAPIALPLDSYFPKFITLATPVRVFEPLEEVQPVSKQTNSNTKPAIYGNPDFIVTGEELTKTGSNTDLVNSLVGNVPVCV